jgi:phosphoglucosamine mutase
MGRSLFGTDGVRGPTGGAEAKLTPELALALGRAVTREVREVHDRPRPQVLILRDTRESGPMLETALAAGVAAAGGDALRGGVLPTPAAPLLLARHGFDLAAVISASHNPYEDNGIKFFGPDGLKLTDRQEEEIEARLAGEAGGSDEPGAVRELHGALEDYLRALHERFAALDLHGKRIVLDCAHGATYRAAPEIFRRLGAEVTVVGERPDGRNINAGCGSTSAATLAERADLAGAHAAFAFDGDGDRVLAVDAGGTVVDGDELIALAAIHLREQDRLPGGGVAVTVMTNYGFHRAMEEAGVAVATTGVGDRYVLAELIERGWALGGEQSGHIIDLGFAPSGDGVASALLVLEALGDEPLERRGGMEKLPQVLVNVRVGDRSALQGSSELDEAVARESEALEGRGRVLLRPSGTEPVMRVMAEAPTEDEAQGAVDRLCGVVQSLSGA